MVAAAPIAALMRSRNQPAAHRQPRTLAEVTVGSSAHVLGQLGARLAQRPEQRPLGRPRGWFRCRWADMGSIDQTVAREAGRVLRCLVSKTGAS
jgi:hypothetical protein